MSTIEQFKDNLQAYADVCNSGRGTYKPLTVFQTQKEFNIAARLLHTHAGLLGQRTFGQGNSIRGQQSMWMTHIGYRIAIQYEQPKPAANVRESSREAFAAIDTTTQVGQVALCIIEASVNGGDITRAEIAHFFGMEKSTVAARVNELVETCKETPVKDGNAYYRIIELDDRRHSLTPDAPPVKVIALRAIMCAPENYQPAAPAAQTTMF